MPTPTQIDRCFSKPVIPVFWDSSQHERLLAFASSVILQGGTAAEIAGIVERLRQPPLDHLRVFVHIDLVSGLENSEAGLELLASLGSFDGIVTVHKHLIKPAEQLGLLSVLRIFLTDTRALERGLNLAAKARPDIVEVLPAAAAVRVADEFRSSNLPFITGGLCRTKDDVQEAVASGCLAVTSTAPALWKLNQ